MTGETQHFEKKSLRKVTGASADWHGLAESCVAFATAHGGLLRVGIEDGADTPPKGQVIPSDLPSTIAQRIGQLTVNVTVDAVIREADNGGAFVEVHVATSLEECERRDRKGLYKLAREGKIKEFTGISDPYEVPKDAEVSIDTTDVNPDEAAQDILLHLERQGYIGARRG